MTFSLSTTVVSLEGDPLLYLMGQDAESDEAELAGEKSIQALQAEISDLRTKIKVLARRDLDP